MRIGWVVVSAVAVFLLASPVQGQEAVEAEGSINVFLDCNTFGCDFDYFRREIPVVNWVRDREDADVHILITSRTTGGGGRSFELSFIGLQDFTGRDTDLSWASSGDAVQDEVRGGVSEQLKIGLVTYVAGTPAAERMSVSFGPAIGAAGPGVRGPGGPPGAVGDVDDPWDSWVFSVSANGNAFGESSLETRRISGSVSANRTTEDWKINLRANWSENKQIFELTDTTIEQVREDWSSSGSLIRSIGGQWAVGLRAEAGQSTFFNEDFSWSVKPGIEYNFFPYEESSRRSLTLQYLIGPSHWDWAEETIYGFTSETRVQHSLTANLGLVQPWGQWNTSVSGQQYMHDTDLNRLTFSGGFEVRLFKGFSVGLHGNYSWIRDQLHIEAGNLSDEEVLLRQRQLATSFQYFTFFNIRYRFGSIFNNVVNPRFGGGGGGMRIMM